MISSKIPAVLWIILLPFLAWELSQQARLLSTLENNAWSISVARQAFSTATASDPLPAPPPASPHARLWLGRLSLRQQLPQQAQEWVAPLAARGDPFARHVMADALTMQGNFAEVVTLWQKAGDAASLLRVASQASRLEDIQAAYQAAWTLDPESGALPLANFLLNSKKDSVAAENVLQQSLAALPNSKSWSAWSNLLGDAVRAQKRWDEAIAIYGNVIAQNPDSWMAHIGLGWARYERGDGLQAAIGEFQKAIDIPKSQGNGQLAIAQMLTQEKRFAEADAWFAQALVLNPNARWWYVSRGNAALQAKNPGLAIAIYQETLAKFPDFSYAYYQIAYAYQLNKQPAEAITAIEHAIAIMTPPNIYYYIRAGSIYEWAGDESQASYAYHQALLIDPQNTVALEGMNRLDK